MTYRREKDLQEKVREAILKKYGDKVWYFHPCDRYRKGIPDIIMVFFHFFVAIELKKEISIYGPTKMQLHNMEKIFQAGGFTFVSDNFLDIMDFLNHLHIKYLKQLNP